MAKPLIICRDLEVLYNQGKPNEFKALQDINADIYEGEFIILFGPSGSGKSTFLYTIQGSLPPENGRLLIRGDDIYRHAPEKRVHFQRHVMGTIFQSFNLIHSLSVLDNVALPMTFSGIDRQTRERRARTLLERFDVGAVADKFPAMLSGGQSQRVAVARSLVNDPKILLADEPTGNLDSVSALQVMNKISEVNSINQKTVIMVSHNASHLPYAHRVYYLKDGRIVREVVNPLRKQIKPVKEGETIVTELEQLARLFPYDSIETLRVKSITNYLTQKYSYDQLIRIEQAISFFISGKTNKAAFITSLAADYSKGGAGMTEKAAREFAARSSKIVDQAADVRRFRSADGSGDAFFNQRDFATRLKTCLLKRFEGALSKKQESNLVELIADRVTGVSDHKAFLVGLKSSLTAGGLGMSASVAQDMSRYFEKLIAQGVDVRYKK